MFTGTGKKSDYKDILKDAGKADVVFFGELQDDIDKMNDESLGLADYVIVIPSSMTRTYK